MFSEQNLESINLGNKMRKERESRNISQVQLCKEIGLDRKTYSKYERGDTKISAIDLKKIASFLGISTDYLLDLTTVSKMDPEIREVCEYTGLNENTIEKLHLFTCEVPFNSTSYYPNTSSCSIYKTTYFPLKKGFKPQTEEIASQTIRELLKVIDDYLSSKEFQVFIQSCLETKRFANSITELAASFNTAFNDNIIYSEYDSPSSDDAYNFLTSIDDYKNVRDQNSFNAFNNTIRFLYRFSGLSDEKISIMEEDAKSAFETISSFEEEARKNSSDVE